MINSSVELEPNLLLFLLVLATADGLTLFIPIFHSKLEQHEELISDYIDLQ